MKKPHEDMPKVEEDKKDAQRPLTREQRRMKERIEKEADEKLTAMIGKFSDFLIDCENPEVDVPFIQKTMSAQWKLYCVKKRLTGESSLQFDIFSNKVLDQYKALKGED